MVCPGEVNDLLLSSDDTPTTVIEERILAIRAQLEKS